MEIIPAQSLELCGPLSIRSHHWAQSQKQMITSRCGPNKRELTFQMHCSPAQVNPNLLEANHPTDMVCQPHTPCLQVAPTCLPTTDLQANSTGTPTHPTQVSCLHPELPWLLLLLVLLSLPVSQDAELYRPGQLPSPERASSAQTS